jgi:hypothetical protein
MDSSTPRLGEELAMVSRDQRYLIASKTNLRWAWQGQGREVVRQTEELDCGLELELVLEYRRGCK